MIAPIPPRRPERGPRRWRPNWERLLALAFALTCWGLIFAGLKSCGVWP